MMLYVKNRAFEEFYVNPAGYQRGYKKKKFHHILICYQISILDIKYVYKVVYKSS